MADKKKPSEDSDDELEPKDEEDTQPHKKEGEDDGEDAGGEGDDDLVPVRRSSLVAKDHIIARQQRKIAKMKQGEEKEDEDEEELEPAASEIIGKKVEEAVAPIRKHLLSREDEAELSELYGNEPEAKELDKQIRKYMTHPGWANVPIAAIYHHLAFNKAAGQRTDRQKAADREAAASRVGGHPRRPKSSSSSVPELDDLDNMTDEDVEKLSDRVKAGEFLDK